MATEVVAIYAAPMARVLIIEDDPATASEIAAELVEQDCEVEVVHDGAVGLARAVVGGFDAVTLDRMLPGLDGLGVIKALREQGVQTPVLMISALSDVDDRIAGLRAGGDDYMVKPFAPSEMAMRVAALLRRSSAADTMLRAGYIELDMVRRLAHVEGVPTRLLQMEFRLLELFLRNAGQVLSRRLIFEKVWSYTFDPGANLINVHIGRLRKKLERPGRPSPITTVKGEGYRFDVGD
ncbi:MAG: response regulator transcription factor [Janthinobacterium lividum]